MKSLFEGLPSLHPLLVHFPIVLLLTALISHIGALLLKKHRRPFTVLTFGLLLLGTLGALAAIQTATHISGDADEGAFTVFEIHQRFAWISFWIASSTTVLHFVGLRKDTGAWINYLILILLISLSVILFITGHHGARLVYQYGVGPMGNGILIN